jgi:hypothetical protein
VAQFEIEPLPFNRIVVVRYRMYLELRSLAANTINQQLAAVRRLAHEAADSGLLSPELAAGISRVKGVKQLGFRSGNWLSAEESSEVLKCARGNSMRAKRDYAMLALLFGCGFRRSELVGLELDEVQMRQGHMIGCRMPPTGDFKGRSTVAELSIDCQPVGDLRSNPHNARTHSKPQIRQIAESIKTFGFTGLSPIERAAYNRKTDRIHSIETEIQASAVAEEKSQSSKSEQRGHWNENAETDTPQSEAHQPYRSREKESSNRLKRQGRKKPTEGRGCTS